MIERCRLPFLLAAILAVSVVVGPFFARGFAQGQAEEKHNWPWMNTMLSPDERANLVLKEMTLDEKIGLMHGNGMPGWRDPYPTAHLGNGGAGFVLGVPRLGIPIIQMSDAAYGVRNSGDNGRYSTALPSNVGSAASWDIHAACEYGELIGRELRAQGYNMTLGGGVDIKREPRNGRTFEYMGEDPILAGTLVGNRMKCEQAQHVIGDIKHYAANDQESGRNEVDAVIGKRALRESDLLAFEIGIGIANPGAVMCSYNSVNGDFACENKYLLTDVLKKGWGFKGFVVSDWAGTHSTVKASAAGLDNEEPFDQFFGAKLKEAVQAGKVPAAELDDHARRILRSEFACGIIDYPVQKGVVDVEGGLETARRLAEQSTVLLKHKDGVLPLDRTKVHSIAIIAAHADTSMISGGGSAQLAQPGRPGAKWQEHIRFPTSPLQDLSAKAPSATVQVDSGATSQSAVELAKKSEVTIVFAHQWTSEGMDLPNLSLPDYQDGLIEKVAAANPRTIVVLETGTAVTMPWLEKVSGVVEAWYAGSKGADAVANILFGDVNPSAKLAISFPKSEKDLPHPVIPPEPPPDQAMTYTMNYDEGAKAGYKWYEAENKQPLFPFGFGLSYATYEYSNMAVGPDAKTVRFTVKNTGPRAGTEIAEVYARLPNGSDESFKRLVGWKRIALAPGESQTVTVSIDQRPLQTFDEATNGWTFKPGDYAIFVGPSSDKAPLTGKLLVH